MKKDNRTWTDEQLIEALKTSNSKSEAIRKLGLKMPGSFKVINKYIQILNVDTSHFNPKAQYTKRLKLSLDDLLVENSTRDYKYIKSRVLREKLLPLKCAICSITTWQNKPLTLAMDHINGVNNDHRIENLRLICPNCHSQTDTYCGKNAKHAPKIEYHCLCGKTITRDADHCRTCYAGMRRSKIEWPSLEVLIKDVDETSFTAVGKRLGVSGNAVKKRIGRQEKIAVRGGVEPPTTKLTVLGSAIELPDNKEKLVG